MEAKFCKQCHQPVSGDAPQGLCPQCLAKIALGTEPAAPGNRTPPNPADLAQQFPQFEIVELLGMGGMGMVYKARQPKLDRLIALKILPIDSAQGPSFAERFEREAKALAKLNHPGIVAIYDFGQTDSYYYFVMEFVDGMNLRQLLRAQKLSPDEALQLVSQICAALQFAHEEGIVHRDIKPENILINKKGVAKIADFGLAKLLGHAPDTNLTASQMVMGTVNYMAPEQREKPLTVDHRADIYSLGVVFYEMLTGELPLGRFAPPSQKVQVDVGLDEVVLKSLEKEPDRRYQHASEVKTDVESVAGSPTSGRPPAMQAAIQPAARVFDWHDFATEVSPSLAILALVGFGMEVIKSAWPVFFLFISSFRGHRNRNLKSLETARLIWIIGVVALSAYGVWIANSIWPMIGLLFVFDWGKAEHDDEKSTHNESSPRSASVPPPLPSAAPSRPTRPLRLNWRLTGTSAAVIIIAVVAITTIVFVVSHHGNIFHAPQVAPQPVVNQSQPGREEPRDPRPAVPAIKLKFVRADGEETSAQGGYGENAVDGNPGTYWHTKWGDDSPGFPHEIILELHPPSTIKGFTYLPRQDESDHGDIRNFEFYVSDDGENFGAPVKKGAFKVGKEEKVETFASVKCRFIKLKAISEVNGLPWASAAEIGVIPADQK